MTSKTMRDNPLFMRNKFESIGKWGLPIIKKQELNTDNIMLVACSDTRKMTEMRTNIKVFISLLMIIAFKVFTIIPKEHLIDILNTPFFFRQIIQLIPIWICGDSSKVSVKTAGWELTGKARD